MSLLLMHNPFRNLDQTPKKKREDQYHSVFTVNMKLQSAARFFAQRLERKKKMASLSEEPVNSHVIPHLICRTAQC